MTHHVELRSRAYFEARLAFVDRPEARVRLLDSPFGGVDVEVAERIDGRVWAVRYHLRPGAAPAIARVRAHAARQRFGFTLGFRLVGRAGIRAADALARMAEALPTLTVTAPRGAKAAPAAAVQASQERREPQRRSVEPSSPC